MAIRDLLTSAGENLKNLGEVYNRFGAIEKTISYINKAADFTDTYAKNENGLNKMNEALAGVNVGNTAVLQTAIKSNSSYDSTMNLVTGLGAAEEGVFKNTQEVLDVTDQLNKRFALAYMSEEEMAQASSNVVSALSDGVVNAEEYESIISSIPGSMQALEAAGLGEQQFQVGVEGNDFVTAILAATDQINAEFGKLPVTFGRVWETIKGIVTSTVGPILAALEPLFTGPGFGQLLSTVGMVFGAIVGIISGAIGIVSSVFGFLLNAISPLIPALALFGVYLLITSTNLQIAALRTTILTTAKNALTSAVKILKLAFTGLKTAFTSSMFWFIVLAGVILLIIKNFGNLKEAIISVVSTIIDFFENLINSFIRFANFFIEGVNKILSFFGIDKQIELIGEVDFSGAKEGVKDFVNDFAEGEEAKVGLEGTGEGGLPIEGDTGLEGLLGEDGQLNVDSLGDVEGLEDYDLEGLNLNTDSLGTGDYSGYGFGTAAASPELTASLTNIESLLTQQGLDMAMTKEDVSAIRAIAEKDGMKKEYYLGGINFSNVTESYHFG